MTDRYHFYFCFTDGDSASGKLINLSMAVQVIWGSQGLNWVVWLWSPLAYCCQMPLVCGIFHAALLRPVTPVLFTAASYHAGRTPVKIKLNKYFLWNEFLNSSNGYFMSRKFKSNVPAS